MKWKLTVEEQEWKTLEDVASEFGVSPLALWEMYYNIMRRNFRQDLWDIANENEEELKKEE